MCFFILFFHSFLFYIFNIPYFGSNINVFIFANIIFGQINKKTVRDLCKVLQKQAEYGKLTVKQREGTGRHGMKRFCILLAACLLLFALPLSAGALTESDEVILAYGDSITASGAWFSEAEKQYGITIRNRGTGGWNSADGAASFAKIAAEEPDLLLLSFGMNDASLDMKKYVPLAAYERNLRGMIERAHAADIRVVLVIENPIGEEAYYTRHDKAVFEPYGGANAFYFRYVQTARSLAAEYGLVTADLYAVFEGTENLNAYLADGVHPNEKGYGLYAAALCDALLRLDLGDISGDGKTDARDYMALKRHVLGRYTIGRRELYADINRDGSADAKDYILLKRHVLGTYQIDRNG